MCRHEKGSVTKSEVVEILKHYWPEAWCDKDEIKIKHKLVVIDGMQILRDCIQSDGAYEDWKNKCTMAPDPLFSSKNIAPKSVPITTQSTEDSEDVVIEELQQDVVKLRTFADVVMVFKKLVDRYFSRSAAMVFITFDKTKYVPIEKSCIQTKRAKNSIDVSQAPSVDLVLHDGAEVNKIHWDAYLHDRDNSREKIISAITLKLVNYIDKKNQRFAPNLRNDTCLYVDGHCFNDNQLKEIGIIDTGKDVAYDIPLCLSCSVMGKAVRLDHRVSNNIGEAECALPYYLNVLPENLITDRNAALPLVQDGNNEDDDDDNDTYDNHVAAYDPKGVVTALMVTTDTDGVWITTTHLDNVAKKEGNHKQPIIDISRRSFYRKPEYFRANLLYNGIQTCSQLSALDNKVLSLMLAIYSAGTDYTLPHYWVNHKRFVEALMEHADEIGDLVFTTDMEGKSFFNSIKINPQAYLALVLWAYREANDRLRSNNHITYSNINKYLDGTLGKSKPIKADKFFPCVHDMEYSILQVWWYALMIHSVGKSTLNIRNSLEYAYEKIDTSKEYTRGNVKWKLCKCVMDNAPATETKPKKTTSKRSAEKPLKKESKSIKIN